MAVHASQEPLGLAPARTEALLFACERATHGFVEGDERVIRKQLPEPAVRTDEVGA